MANRFWVVHMKTKYIHNSHMIAYLYNKQAHICIFATRIYIECFFKYILNVSYYLSCKFFINPFHCLHNKNTTKNVLQDKKKTEKKKKKAHTISWDFFLCTIHESRTNNKSFKWLSAGKEQ